MNRTKEQLDFKNTRPKGKRNVLIRILICPFMDFIKILDQKTENEIWFNKNSLFLLPFFNKIHCAYCVIEIF